MTHNTFHPGTVPPAPPTMPGYPPTPPGPTPRHNRRWPVLLGAAALGAVIAAGAAATITTHTRTAEPVHASTPVTVTVPAPPPTPPAPLPTAQANRQTCGPRIEASRLISEASAAQGVIPEGMSITDPAVRSNDSWTTGVLTAGSLYTQAGEVLVVAPGTTPLIAEAVGTAAAALHALGTAYSSFHGVNGNAYEIAKEASDAMDVVCLRLAP